MNFQKIIFINFFVGLPGIILAQQPIVIEKNAVELTRVTTIEKNIGAIESTLYTDLKTVWRINESAINFDGSSLISLGQLIKINDPSSQIIDLLKYSDSVFKPKFSIDGNIVTYWGYTDEFKASIHIFDIMQNTLIYSYTFENNPYAAKQNESSCDGSTVTTSNDMYINIFKKNKSGYEKVEIGPHLKIGVYFISKSGSRVIYAWTDDIKKYIYGYVDKTADGWSNEKEISSVLDPLYTSNLNELRMRPVAIADDGKTMVLRTNKNSVAIIHEVDDKWTEPEIIGDFEIHIPSDLIYQIDAVPMIFCSEDGRVIIIEQPRDIYYWGVGSYDVFAIIKDKDGKWNKHQVNPADRGVQPDVMLSGNGRKLYWVPYTDPYKQPSGASSGNLK